MSERPRDDDIDDVYLIMIFTLKDAEMMFTMGMTFRDGVADGGCRVKLEVAKI